MSKIIVVTDSNAGITIDEANKLGIKIVPMPFLIQEETYYEGISLSQNEFYDLLKKDVNISTSQPSIGEVIELWDKLLVDYDEIIHIPMSSKLSMSYQTAFLFASERPYLDRVHVVDNKRISVTQKHSVCTALRLIKEGKNGSQIKQILEEQAADSSIYIMVDTLKYLKKGGRVTAAGAALGTLLGIKPVLQIQGGKLDAYKKVRGNKAARRTMIDALKADIKNKYSSISKLHIYVAYTYIEEEAEQFLQEIKKEFPGALSYELAPLSLSVSCHIGPGALAIAAAEEK